MSSDKISCGTRVENVTSVLKGKEIWTQTQKGRGPGEKREEPEEASHAEGLGNCRAAKGRRTSGP